MAEIVTLTNKDGTKIVYPQTRDTAVYDSQGNPITDVYAPITSPILSGTPMAPTANTGTNTDQIATTKFVNNAVSAINPEDIGAQTALTGAQGQIVGFNENGKAVAQTFNMDIDTGVTSFNGQKGAITFKSFYVGTSAPSDTNVLWIDTSNGLKYYNGTSWVVVPVAYSD